MRLIPTMTALALAAGAAPALAQDDPAATELPRADKPGRDTITVVLAAALVPSYEGSNDYNVIPAGFIRGRVSGFNFVSRGTEIDLDLVRDHLPLGLDLQAGPAINLNLNRVGRLIDPRVRALGGRSVALEAGGYVALSKTGVLTSAYDVVSARVTVVADVTGVNRSYQITPSIEYGTPLSRRAFVGLSLSGTWVGDRYAQSYFAVDAAGSRRSGLPIFADPRGGFKNYQIALIGSRALTGDLRHGLVIVVRGSYGRLQGDFARSPLVGVAGSRDQWFGALGLGYTF